MSHEGSKVDMRRYLEGDEDTLHCEVRRYSTGGIVMRWPITGAQDHDVWFTCTIRHTQGLFVITTFLRHTPTASAQGQVDYLQWITVNDRDLLTTSGNNKTRRQERQCLLKKLDEKVIYSTKIKQCQYSTCYQCLMSYQ